MEVGPLIGRAREQQKNYSACVPMPRDRNCKLVQRGVCGFPGAWDLRVSRSGHLGLAGSYGGMRGLVWNLTGLSLGHRSSISVREDFVGRGSDVPTRR